MNIDRGLLPPGTGVLCAVSGGADSLCLLHLLWTRREELGLRVCAAHYEHGLRGEESLRDQAFVRAVCEEWGIPFVTESGNVRGFAAERRIGLEEAARELRYDFLRRKAEELGCSRIATAHNADDNAETLLLHLVRGSGLKGLGGIPPRRGILVRPLLRTTRAEIERYLAYHHVPHVEDSSNGDEAFSRNRIRRQVMPELRGMNGALCETLGRTAELLRQDESYLHDRAVDWIVRNWNGESVPAAELKKLHPAIASRVLRELSGQDLSFRHVEDALRFAEGTERGELDLPGLRLRREMGRLYIGEKRDFCLFSSRVIALDGVTPIPELGLCVRTEKGIFSDEEIHSQFNTFCLRYEKIVGGVICTARRSGDRMHPAGRGVGKSLKALFLERRMREHERAETLVFRDDEGIVAAWPLAVDERCAPRPGDVVLRLTVDTWHQEI